VRNSRHHGGNRPRPWLVTIIQPYVPAYRVPLFDQLSRLLADSGAQLQVVHGSPDGEQADRGDARAGTWSRPTKARAFRFRGHELHFRSVLRAVWHSDIVVAELASTNLDTYLTALLFPRKLMLWGHGKAYVTDASELDARLELWLARRAERVFVYTEGGAAYLRSVGYDAERLTVVRNSTDTVALRGVASEVSAEVLAAFRRRHDLGEGPVACFVGSFDESKCLPLLFAAAELVHERLPHFRLVVAGAGALQGLVNEAVELSFVRVLPRADILALATIGRASDFMVIPGRVGLIAVDALALGLPVVTTNFPYHAPEAEYLTSEVSVIAPRNAPALADAIVKLATDSARLANAQGRAYELGGSITIQAMAQAIAEQLLPEG
jgi:glycosyltransferase involved in cell wall biosynthesis